MLVILFVTSLAEVWIETNSPLVRMVESAVTSLAEVWIETSNLLRYHSAFFVTSLAEVWIETLFYFFVDLF